jgi:hypothetical protein
LTLDALCNWPLAEEEAAHVYIFSDIQKRPNKTMLGDADEWCQIPESCPLAVQFLLLFKVPLAYGLGSHQPDRCR